MLALIVILAFGQIGPDTVLDNHLHSAMFVKWVQTAKAQADAWSFLKSDELFPIGEMGEVGLRNPALSRQLEQRKEYARVVLKKCAYVQIREAYDISEKEFAVMLKDRRVASLPFLEEHDFEDRGEKPVKMVKYPWGFNYTRFNPAKVTVPPKTARMIRYQNPPKPTVKKPEMFSEQARKRMKEDQKKGSDTGGVHADVVGTKRP